MYIVHLYLNLTRFILFPNLVQLTQQSVSLVNQQSGTLHSTLEAGTEAGGPRTGCQGSCSVCNTQNQQHGLSPTQRPGPLVLQEAEGG